MLNSLLADIAIQASRLVQVSATYTCTYHLQNIQVPNLKFNMKIVY